MKAILRRQRYFSTPELVRLYKAHVLSYIESGTPGFFHAAASNLDCIEKIQRRFLRAVGLSEERALLDYRLAPLQTRRCIGILGFLHRVVLGQVSAQIFDLFSHGTSDGFSRQYSFAGTRWSLRQTHQTAHGPSASIIE